MAEIDNGYGEMIPDELEITIPEYRFEYEFDVHVAPIDSRSQYNTLQPRQTWFTYMDCGQWGGNEGIPQWQRSFGVVWGRWAALCVFMSSSGSLPSRDSAGKPLDRNAQPLWNMLAALTGPNSHARVRKHSWSRSHIEPNWDKIYVFLPDLHFPLVRGGPRGVLAGPPMARRIIYRHDGPAMGRYEYLASNADQEGMILGEGGHFTLGQEALQWFNRYLAGDIFQSADADLILFLNRLSQYNQQPPIHLVQLGDMYDLWIGLYRYYRSDASRVMLGVPIWGTPGSPPMGQRDITPEQFINYWVMRTNGTLPSLISAFNSTRVGQKSWLSGNHDNYLAVHTPTNTSRRVREIRQGGIYIEHGHRGDSWNCDGTIGGHWITNQVFQYPWIRSLDPNRRRNFVETAANSFVYRPDFCVYVMGHTHSPYLTHVKITRQVVHINGVD
jgi:hypothetical protein